MLSRVSCRSLVTSARGGAPNMRLRENWEATICLQLVPDSRHHPGIHRPLYPLLYLTAQRFHFLCRVAHHNETPFTRIQLFANTDLSDRHREPSPPAFQDTAPSQTPPLSRPAPPHTT